MTESYPPPDNIHLVDYSVNPNILTFTWDPLLTNCSTLNYTITTTNCGRCLPPASHTTTVCADAPISRNPCIFRVRTDVCGTIVGIESEPLLVQFKGNLKIMCMYLHVRACEFMACIIIYTHAVIDPPIPKVIPQFSCTDQTLTIDVKFNKTVRSLTIL